MNDVTARLRSLAEQSVSTMDTQMGLAQVHKDSICILIFSSMTSNTTTVKHLYSGQPKDIINCPYEQIVPISGLNWY